MNFRKKLALSALLSGVSMTAILCPSVAAAQSEVGASTDDVIVVTARKRAESLLEVPAAVSVVTGELSETLRANDVDEVIELIPNVTLNTNGFTGKIDIQARGIGNPPNIATFDPSVAIYRDGFYISGGGIRSSQLVDVDRIEVLKGPQGGVYGRNAVSGVFLVNFNEPQFDDYEAHLEAEYSRFERTEVWGSVNLPVSDVFAVRVAGWSNNQNDSETENGFLNEPFATESDFGVRGMARFMPNDNWDTTLTVEYQETEPAASVDTGSVTNSLFSALFSTPPVVSTQTIDTVFRNRPTISENEFLFVSLSTEYETDFGVFTGLISYTDREGFVQRDQDFTSEDPTAAANLVDAVNTIDSEGEDLFIEVRYDTPSDRPLRAQFGISYLSQDQIQDGIQDTFVDLPDAFETAPTAFGGLGLPAPLGVIDGSGLFFFEQELSSIAGYIDTQYDVNDRLTAGLALRYTSDEKEGVQRQGLTGNPILVGLFAASLPTLETTLEETFDDFSFAGDLSYSVNDEVNLYFRAATGFRAGGLNEIASSASLLPFDTETTLGFEVGAKYASADGRFAANFAAYHQTLDDALLFVQDPGNPASNIAVNAGETRAIGVEADMSYQPWDGVSLIASAGYVDSELTEISQNAASLGGLVGNRPTQVPEWTSAVALVVEQPLTEKIGGFFATTYSYTGDMFDDIANTEELGSLSLLDISAGIDYENFRILGFVDNVTEDRRLTQISNLNNPVLGTVNRETGPRTYGVRVIADF